MNASRIWVAIAALVLLAPTALADATLRAASLDATGDIRLDGDVGGFFVVADGTDFLWDITAESVVVERRYRDILLAIEHPLNGAVDLYERKTDATTETVYYSGATLVSDGVQPMGAMLVRGSDDALVTAQTAAGLRVRVVVDPRADQDAPPDAEAPESTMETIHERFDGEFIEATLEGASLVLRGDLVLDLYGVDYTLSTSDESVQHRTGRHETEVAGPAHQGREERHHIYLTGAEIRVHVAGASTLLTHFPTLRVDGALAPTGEPATRAASPVYALAIADGLVLAAPPQQGELGTTSGAIVEQGPPFLTLSIALFLLVAGAGALVLLRRRAPREDDLELALLAMEERRWGDALPRLARVAKSRPNDAGVQVDRALCLEQVGRFGEAAHAFEAALRRAPEHAEAHFYYARTLAKMRESEAARAHLEAALERDPRLVELARGETVLRGL